VTALRTPARTSAAGGGAPLAAAGVALLALVLGLLLAGGAPAPAPVGLPDAGPVVGWAVPVLRLVQHVAAVATVGALLVGLLAGRDATVGRGEVAMVALPATTWALAALGSLVVGLAEITGRPLSTVLDPDLIRSYVEQVATGRALLWTALLAASVTLAASAAHLMTGRAALLVLALSALVPTLRTGHAATASDHTLSVTATSVHVVAVVLWVGGLAALVATARRPSLPVVLPRFSALALLCFLAVVGSGAVSSWTRLQEPEQLWATGYGGLLLAKTAAVGLLGAAGWLHRRRSLAGVAAGSPGAFTRLAVAEVALMAVALGLAVALSRSPL
jgi:putative copper resistance protein D